MQNIKHTLKFSGLVFLAGLMAACNVLQQVIEKPTVHVKTVQYQSVSLKEGRLDSRLQVMNPNSFALPLRKLSYHLKLNGRVFADSKLDFDKNIPAKGTIELHVPIHFQYGELLHGLSSILTHRDIRFQLAGKLDLGMIEIPFSKTGEFVLKY